MKKEQSSNTPHRRPQNLQKIVPHVEKTHLHIRQAFLQLSFATIRLS